MYQRLCKPSKKNSFLLFGPRQTGKSTLLQQWLGQDARLAIDLLEPQNERKYSARPELLAEEIATFKRGDWVVLDEIQKQPKLLDVVHRSIETQGIRFALTGSSARKLRHGAANLLAGRAFEYRLYPLCRAELGKDFKLETVLKFGGLPKLYSYDDDADKVRFLMAYAHTYLKEEIQVEQLVRKIEPFRLFLEVAAQASGKILNFAKLGKQARVDGKAVERYFEILNDTFIGFYLNAYSGSVRAQQRQHPKFYFFDTGVMRAIDYSIEEPVRVGSYEFGRLFEHFFIHECIKLSNYLECRYRFAYLRTKDDAEIDLIIARPGKKTLVIEIKSADQVDQTEINKLQRLAKDIPKAEAIIACRESVARISNGVRILPWEKALTHIFGEIT